MGICGAKQAVGCEENKEMSTEAATAMEALQPATKATHRRNELKRQMGERPTQEVSAAKAEEEVAAATSAADVAKEAAARRLAFTEGNIEAFTDEESLLSLLDGHPPPIRLLRGPWILQRAQELAAESRGTRENRAREMGGVHPLALPKRQDLERQFEGRLHEVFLDPEELQDLQKFPRGSDRGGHPLPLICASHAWRHPEHPDPLGDNLIVLAEAIKRQQSLPAEAFVPHELSRAGAQPLVSSFALFFDWACLPQKERSEDENAAFKRALSHMQILYAHKKTLVYMLTQQPAGWTGRPYHERGWPTFEMRVSMLLKSQSSWAWNNLVDTGETWDPAMAHTQRAKILPPLTPKAFKKLLGNGKDLPGKVFTNDADVDVVAELYKKTIEDALGQTTELRFAGVGWSEADLDDLIDVLPLCSKLETLNIDDNSDLTAAAGKRLAEALQDHRTAPALKLLKAAYSGGVTEEVHGGELQRACEARGIKILG